MTAIIFALALLACWGIAYAVTCYLAVRDLRAVQREHQRGDELRDRLTDIQLYGGIYDAEARGDFDG